MNPEYGDPPFVWDGWTAPPRASMRRTNSSKTPRTSWVWPSREKEVMHGPTSPAVRFPPREPNRSTSRTDAPLRAAATAAASPAGPLPTTRTSDGFATGIVRVYVRVSTLIPLLRSEERVGEAGGA